jgi:FkbM family methyltransferase
MKSNGLEMFSMFRNVADFRGKRRLVKSLLGDKIGVLRDIEVNGKFGCSYLLPNLKENVGFDIFVNGIYEEGSYNILKRLLPENGFFLDIGGNIGAITIPICKTRPDIRAVAIEAAPWIYSYLERNVDNNGLRNVKLLNYAVYDKSDIEVDFYCPTDVYGKGSMAAVFTSQSVKVRTVTIDTLPQLAGGRDFDVIKVDVEGFEYFVFKGGEEMLRKNDAPMVFFEFIDWAESSANGLEPGAAQRVLRDYGYRLHILDGGKWIEYSDIKEKGSFDILACKGQFSEICQ